MDVPELFNRMPFGESLGIEVLDADDGRGVGKLELIREHSSRPNAIVVHGGVTDALADTVGGAAAISANGTVTPTIEMRIDYLAPATGGVLRAEAEVIRNGNSVAAVGVEITDDDGTEIATVRGCTNPAGAMVTPRAWTADCERRRTGGGTASADATPRSRETSAVTRQVTGGLVGR